MKPRNFPARRLARQIRAQGAAHFPNLTGQLEAARAIRTKKDRSGKGKLA